MKIRIAFNGILGKMGRSISTGLAADPDFEICAGYDPGADRLILKDGLMIGGICVRLCESMEELFNCRPEAVIDFSNRTAFLELIRTASKQKVNLVIGTTGLSDEDLNLAKQLVNKSGISAIIAPNFSIGAVLMMKFASIASDYLSGCEIIELHHNQKIDAPSGTAIKTAGVIKNSLKSMQRLRKNEFEKYEGARGAIVNGIHVHSVRLPGLLAHQEVIMGAQGQTLTIRHDTFDRSAYLPGVILALKKLDDIKGLIYGLENLI